MAYDWGVERTKHLMGATMNELYASRPGDVVTGGWTQDDWNRQMPGDWMNPNPPATAETVAELEALPLGG